MAKERKNAAAVRLGLLLGLMFCTTGASCTRSLRSPFAPWQPPAPEVLMVGSSLDQVITAVNQNAARVQSLQSNNASITVPGMPGVPLLRGNIAAQRPGRFRLQASTALTGPEVDMGSNDELFWFWVKRNQPPALYYARHGQFAGSAAQQLMPIEPQWLLDAIGFAEFRPGDVHNGPLPVGDGKVEITSVVQSRIGQLSKRTVIDSRRAWILEQHVYDGQGTLLASATAKSHRYYPQVGASLPQEIEIRIPASELSLSIDMGTVQINELTENPQLWALPTIAGAPLIDLGAAPVAAATPQIGRQLAEANWHGPGPMAVGAPAALAPNETAFALAPPAGAAAPSGGPTPQFIHPAGIEVTTPTANATNIGPPHSAAQRLPTGGIASPDGFVR